jgi:hypothetical protein
MLTSTPHHKHTCGERGEICAECAQDCERIGGMDECVAMSGRARSPAAPWLREQLHMFDVKLKEAILGEFKRQAANRPQALKVEGSAEELTVNGKIDLAELVMVIAGGRSVRASPSALTHRQARRFSGRCRNRRRRRSPAASRI